MPEASGADNKLFFTLQWLLSILPGFTKRSSAGAESSPGHSHGTASSSLCPSAASQTPGNRPSANGLHLSCRHFPPSNRLEKVWISQTRHSIVLKINAKNQIYLAGVLEKVRHPITVKENKYISCFNITYVKICVITNANKMQTKGAHAKFFQSRLGL